ncbi:MAG: HAMP domain-containing protein [Betaproteobacteria bacterium]|nr:HAMP domain-containing protein [Betaproteobacteria bacterium]
MFPKTLKFKVGFYLAIALAVAMLLFTLLVIRYQRNQLLEEAVNHVTQLSEVISKSTRYAMLQNQPDYVFRIVQDVGNQENIEKVRILSKDGRIIHSTFLAEIGQKVDRKADACSLCHQSEQPLEQVPRAERSRIYSSPEGRRLLGTMQVIRNEPSCYTSACHVHKKSQTVLGVLDIVYSLDEIDRTIRMNTFTIGAFSLGFILLASLFVSLFVHRLVYVPLRDLGTGAGRLAAGNLEQPIPVRSGDEFGQLSASFNAMTTALKNSREELREWAHTLEQKVETRTRQLRLAEAETARTEKLASVGLLAAGIAHELNNPLTGILTFTHLVRKNMPDGSPDAEDLDLVIRETKRCATIIKRLLDFAREKTPEKKFADLNRLIEDTARIIERPASIQDIEIALDLDRDLPPVWLDEDLIKQVIMNMLVNAQHAIEEGGSISIRTRRCPEPKSAEGGGPVPMVEISVIDTGCGIPEKNLKRIFDPFFTSKEVGKGTGLGLSVSHGIVKAHGGTIEVESTLGEGSTFRVYLPIESPTAETASPSRSDA